MDIVLIDAISPFFRGLARHRINWSKIPFADLEDADGRPDAACFARVAEDMPLVAAGIRSLGGTAATLDDLAHLAPCPHHAAELNAKIAAYQTHFAGFMEALQRQGLAVYVTADYFSHSPGTRAACGDDPARLASVFTDLVRAFFARFPDAAGIILRIGETDGLDVRGDFRSELVLKRPDEVRDFLLRVLPVFEELGKTLVFRTWTVGAYPVGDLLWNPVTFDRVFAGVDSPALLVSIKHNDSDFFRHLPLNPTLLCPGVRKIVELQARREYEGCGEYPSFTGWDVEQLRRKLEGVPGIAGISLWVQTGGWTVFRRLAFLENASPWTDLNAYAAVRVFRDRIPAEAALMDYCRDRLHSFAYADLIELARLSDEVVKELLYLDDFARRPLFFRRVRVPPLFSVYWDQIFVNHSVRKLLRIFAPDGAAKVRQGQAAMRKMERMEELAKRLGLPADDIRFMRDSLRLVALAREYYFLPFSQDRARGLWEAKEAYQKAWPREVRYRYAVKLDFSRQRLSRHRLRSLLRLLVREQPRYRRMDRLVTLGVLSWIAPWLLRRRRDSALSQAAMGIETVFR